MAQTFYLARDFAHHHAIILKAVEPCVAWEQLSKPEHIQQRRIRSDQVSSEDLNGLSFAVAAGDMPIDCLQILICNLARRNASFLAVSNAD